MYFLLITTKKVKHKFLNLPAMNTRSIFALLLSMTIIFSASAISGFQNSCGSFISEPMFGMPAFWLRGDNNTSIIKIYPELSGTSFSIDNSTQIRIVLKKSNGPFSPEFEPVVESVDREGLYYFLNLSIPASVPVDLFDLNIVIETDNGTFSDTQPNAVKIIDEIKSSYSIVHLTDIHVDDIRGFLANPGETLGYKVIQKAISTINLINPELVIITGDLVFGMSYFWEYFQLYRLLQKFDVPIFMSIGNHDAINHAWWLGGEGIDGMKMFQDLFAPLNFSFRYGNLQYISLNSMDWNEYERLGISILNFNWQGQLGEEQLDWFEQQLAATDAGLILTGYHHPPESFKGKGIEEAMTLAQDYDVDAVFNGHTHYDEVKTDEDVLYITTGSLMFDFLSDIHPVFRLIEIDSGEITSYSFDNDEASVPVYKDSLTADFQTQLNTPALFCTYAPSNKGISKTVTATITNHLLESYEEISLEFVMPVPSDGDSYEVTGGEMVETYTAADYQIWYVKTAVNPVLETTVTIQELN